MRGLPFFKPKNKPQFAGLNFSEVSSGGGGGGSSHINYSTELVNTGNKWIDGKDIYRKVCQIDLSDATITSNSFFDFWQNVPTIDTIISVNGSMSFRDGFIRPITQYWKDSNRTHISTVWNYNPVANVMALNILEYSSSTGDLPDTLTVVVECTLNVTD